MIRCGATSRPVATRACAPTIAHDVTIMATAISSQTGMAACVATSAAITITAAMMTATTSATVGLWDCGTVGLWDCGTVGLRDCGTVWYHHRKGRRYS